MIFLTFFVYISPRAAVSRMREKVNLSSTAREMHCHVRVCACCAVEREKRCSLVTAQKTAKSFKTSCKTVLILNGQNDVGEIRQSNHGIFAGRPFAPGGIRSGGCQEGLDGGTLSST